MGLGPVRNTHVRRRGRRNAATRPAATAAAPQPAKIKPAPEKPAPAPKAKEQPKTESKPSSKESTPTPLGTKKPAPKRGAPGGIMQSFAKAAAIPKKASTPALATAPEETNIQALALSDDGEDDSMAMPEPQDETEAARTSRKDRQDALKRMMEDSSEDEEPEKEDTPMEDAEEEAPALEPDQKEDAGPAEVVSSTGDGRRRGKRQIMKKKTVMDEQGYLGMLWVFCMVANTRLRLANSLASHCPRKRLGVVFRGRASTTPQEGRGGIAAVETQKGSSQGPRKHHVFFQQEIVVAQAGGLRMAGLRMRATAGGGFLWFVTRLPAERNRMRFTNVTMCLCMC